MVEGKTLTRPISNKLIGIHSFAEAAGARDGLLGENVLG